MSNFWIALALTTFAGLSTGIGSAVAFFAGKTNFRFLSWATGFSAGVMLYVSFVEILTKAGAELEQVFSQPAASWATIGSFFGGIAFILLIDWCIPSPENPHEVRAGDEIAELKTGAIPHQTPDRATDDKLLRMGLFTALAIAIHNFPEGLATFLAAMDNPTLGLAIAIAIALHNIPEGISVSVPIFYASGNRRRAFVYSLLSGIAEPIGAIVGYLLLRPILSPTILGTTFAGVAGIMVYISLDELLPTSRAYGKGHDSILGLLGGMLVMALSLLLMK